MRPLETLIPNPKPESLPRETGNQAVSVIMSEGERERERKIIAVPVAICSDAYTNHGHYNPVCGVPGRGAFQSAFSAAEKGRH